MALDDDVREMARLPIFQEIEPDALKLLAFSAETRIFRSGDVLFRRGEPSDAGYLVLSGSFRVDPPPLGESEVVINAHALIGEMALLTATERPVTVVAQEPSTALKISRPVFHRVLKEYPKSAVRLRAAVERKLSAFTASLVSQNGA